MVVVAGIASPWNGDDIANWAYSIEDRLPQSAGPVVEDLESMFLSMTPSLGNGLVTVDSARLVGVPLVTVPGNHLSMIRNITKSSSRIHLRYPSS